MNKFVFSALTTTLVGATGFANDTEWPELDRELAALNNAPLIQDSGGPTVSGWLIGAIVSDNSPSQINPGPNTNDNLSTGISAARVNLSGSVAKNYHFVLGWDFTDTGELYAPAGIPVNSSIDLVSSGVPDTYAVRERSGLGGLTDAYVVVNVADGLDLTIGAFNPKFLRSSDIQRNRTLFIDRSYLGGLYSDRDAGVALSGNFNRVNWQVTGTNGHDGSADSFAYSAHIDVDIIGTSSGNEGAYNSGDGANLNVGVTYADDSSDTTANDDFMAGGDGTGLLVPGVALGTSRDARLIAGYATFTMGGFTAWGEIVDQDNDATPSGFVGPLGSGATPWSFGLAYLFGGNYEVALRYDDYDNGATASNPAGPGTTRYNLAVNRYIEGHDIKWQLNYSSGSDDTLTGVTENDVIALGIAVGF